MLVPVSRIVSQYCYLSFLFLVNSSTVLRKLSSSIIPETKSSMRKPCIPHVAPIFLPSFTSTIMETPSTRDYVMRYTSKHTTRVSSPFSHHYASPNKPTWWKFVNPRVLYGARRVWTCAHPLGFNLDDLSTV